MFKLFTILTNPFTEHSFSFLTFETNFELHLFRDLTLSMCSMIIIFRLPCISQILVHLMSRANSNVLIIYCIISDGIVPVCLVTYLSL